MTKSLVDFEEVAALLKKHDHFTVLAHVNPDGDAISSTVAMGLLLQKLGKTVRLVNEDRIPGKFRFLPLASTIQPPLDSDSFAKVVIAVDCADVRRIGISSESLIQGKILVNIDHHPTNDGYGHINVINPEAAATVQILYQLIQFMNIEIDDSLAQVLYTGLLTDTGGFRYSNTTPEVMNMASHLISLGVNTGDIAERVLETLTIPHLHLLQRSLSTVQQSDDGRICWISVTLEDIERTGATTEDIDGLVNYPRNIDGVEVGICFKEIDRDEIKVSFRSRDVDVAAIAKHFSGGGHFRASGCTVRASLPEAIDQVIALVEQAFPNS